MNRELGPIMLADGWRCVGGENLCWNLRGPLQAANTVIVTLCESRYLQGTVLQGDTRHVGFTVAFITTNEDGLPESELYYWAESYSVALRFAVALRATVMRVAT